MSKAAELQAKAHKTAIVVLGVDDQADFTMMRLLGTLGCTLPADMRKKSDAQPLNGFEPVAVRNLNNRLLEVAGSSADDASPFHPEWRQSPGAKAFVRHAVTALEEQFANAPLIALGGRDLPRLFPLWAEALRLFGCSIRPVIMLRNPLEVGKNAQDLEQSSHSLAEAIWIRRALDAEHFTRGTPRYFTSFERLCQSWDLVVQDAQEALQLAWPKPPATVEAHIEELLAGLTFSKDLQARAMTSTLLPPWIRESYKILNGWAMSEEMPAHHVLLDTLRGDFDVAADAFGRVVRAERHAQTKYAEAQRLRMQAELDALSRAAAANEAERASFAVERDAWESEKDKYRTERDDLIRERDALAAERQRLIAEQEVRRAERETLIAKRDGVMAERDRLAAERDSGRAKYDGLVTERDALVTQYDVLAAERGALAAERDTLVVERDALVADRDGIAAERDTLASGRNLLLAEREEWATDRDALRERLSNQQATHDQQSAALKVSLQEQRRTTTLLNAQVQDLKERCDDLQSELDDARAEVAATRARRKEMARVIANRDRQLSARYDELARLQQLALRFDPVWRIRRAFGWIKRRLRGARVSDQPR